jgi:aminopeptidase N
MSLRPCVPFFLALVACPTPEAVEDTAVSDGRGTAPAGQDVIDAQLALDLESRVGRATVTVQPATGARAVRLDVSGLEVTSVTVEGVATEVDVRGGWLVVPVTAASAPVAVTVEYHFPARGKLAFDGWMPYYGVTFIWPYFCGNLYPCNPAIEDGLTFSMEVTGVQAGLEAVYPRESGGVGPPYMPGVAEGTYARLDLGETQAGTRVTAWYFEGERDRAETGTAHLREVVDYLEQTVGPYTFGPEIGSVEVDWGADSWGGMEHHPYSHIARFDLDDEEVHAHEAAHGWFGNGVRFSCWEDFVLSEGTTTWLAARAMEETGGPDLWRYYVDDFLTPICEGLDVNAIVLPDETCNEIDILEVNLWSLAPYMKGACFYEEVGDIMGISALDAVVGAFYTEHVGGSARMADMLDALQTAADPADVAAIEAAEQDWLRSLECPADYAARCRAHAER